MYDMLNYAFNSREQITLKLEHYGNEIKYICEVVLGTCPICAGSTL